MSKFKVGDRVRLRKDRPMPWPSISQSVVEKSIKENRIYTITSIDPYKYGITLHPHDGYGFSADELELVAEESVSRNFGADAPVGERAANDRIVELLQANNDLVERERAAKREAQNASQLLMDALRREADASVELFTAREELSKLRERIGKLEIEVGMIPTTGTLVWITQGGVPHALDRKNGEIVWNPAQLVVAQ